MDFRNPAADIFKTGEGLDDPDPIIQADRFAEIAGHDRFDHSAFVRQCSVLFFALGYIGDQKSACLVAVQGNISALSVGHLDRHAVGIGVCGNEHFGARVGAQLFRKGKGLWILRVRERDCREVRIRILLFGHNLKMCEAPLLRHLHHGYASRPVQGCIDDRDIKIQLFVRALGQREDIVHVAAVHLFSQHSDQALFNRMAEGNSLELVKHIQLFNTGQHAVRNLTGNLGSVFPVHLVAIVFLGVVAGSHVDTGDRPQLSDSIGKFRCGTERRKQIGPDPVPGKNLSRLFRELLRVITAVVGNHNAPGRILPRLEDIIGDALGRAAHREVVHAVGARPAYTPKTGSSELNFHIKALCDLRLVVPDSHKLIVQAPERRICAVLQFFNPLSVYLHSVHIHSSLPI